MFNFSEWLLIAVVGFVVIGPKELPVVIRHVMAFIRDMRALTSGIRAQFHEVVREAGLDDVMNEMHEMRRTTTIIDLDGKPQKTYDVMELKSLEAPKTVAAQVPPPHGGESDTPYPRADHE